MNQAPFGSLPRLMDLVHLDNLIDFFKDISPCILVLRDTFTYPKCPGHQASISLAELMNTWALALLKPGKSFNTYRASTFFWDYCGGLCFSTAWPSSDHFIYLPAQASNHNSKMSWPGSPDGIFLILFSQGGLVAWVAWLKGALVVLLSRRHATLLKM